MRLWVVALALSGAVLVAPAAGAQTRPGFTLGPEASYYSYHESGLAISGPMIGLQGSWTWIPGFLFLRIEAAGDVARVDYSSTASGRTDGITDLKGETRILAGHDLALGGDTFLTPYAGIGYRILYDMQGGTQTDRVPPFFGYNRLSQYLYVPLGLTLDFPLGLWRVRPTVEADYLIEGWQTSYLQDVGFQNSITNTQHDGYGFRGAVMLETGTPWGPLSFGPFLRYWKIGQSDFQALFAGGKSVGQGFEPSNDTLEAGVSLLLSF
jgi:hypothetical protein